MGAGFAAITLLGDTPRARAELQPARRRSAKRMSIGAPSRDADAETAGSRRLSTSRSSACVDRPRATSRPRRRGLISEQRIHLGKHRRRVQPGEDVTRLTRRAAWSYAQWKEAPCRPEQSPVPPNTTRTSPQRSAASSNRSRARLLGSPVRLGQHGSSPDQRVGLHGRAGSRMPSTSLRIESRSPGLGADGSRARRPGSVPGGSYRRSSSGPLDLLHEAHGSSEVPARLLDERGHGERRNQDLRVARVTRERHELLDKNGGLGGACPDAGAPAPCTEVATSRSWPVEELT